MLAVAYSLTSDVGLAKLSYAPCLQLPSNQSNGENIVISEIQIEDVDLSN